MSVKKELQVYEEQINMTLFHDIVLFVADTANEPGAVSAALARRCFFLDPASSGALQDRYGFLYLGELLERYEERYGMSAADLRAIALALGYTREWTTEAMFVGAQREVFLQKVRRSAQGDAYLTGALYLLYEGQSEAAAYEDALNQAQYGKTEELIFVLSLFADYEQAFSRFKAQLLYLLGKERNIPVLGNMSLFNWFIARTQPLLKTVRAKDMALFRALCALPASFVKRGCRHHDILLEQGWSPLEIAYANLLTVEFRTSGQILRQGSVVTEKIAAALFQEVFRSETALPERVYPQLTELFQTYKRFSIQCYGKRDLLDTMEAGTQIQNAETLAWFFRVENIHHPLAQGFDILDRRWDSLVQMVPERTYFQLFELSLDGQTSPEAVKSRIERYDQLTGGDYLSAYWNTDTGSRFSLLVGCGVIDLWDAFSSCLDSEGKIAKPAMRQYIQDYLRGIRTPQAFRFYERFLPLYGFNGLNELLHGIQGFTESFLENPYNHSTGQLDIKLKQAYLDEPMRRQMLSWMEEYFFLREPKRYLSFLAAVLGDGTLAGFLSREEQRALFDLVIQYPELPGWRVRQLKDRYFTPEELQAEQSAQDAAKLARKRKEEMALVKSVQDSYQETVTGTFVSVLNFLNDHKYHREVRQIAYPIVRDQLEAILETQGYELCTAEATALLEVCSELVRRDALCFTQAQAVIAMGKELQNATGNETEHCA